MGNDKSVVLTANFGLDTDPLGSAFYDALQSLQENARVISQLRCNHVLQNSNLHSSITLPLKSITYIPIAS
jgi:hypothetical protein